MHGDDKQAEGMGLRQKITSYHIIFILSLGGKKCTLDVYKRQVDELFQQVTSR